MSTVQQSKNATTITIAGRSVTRWISQSLASTPLKFKRLSKHRKAAADATIPIPPLTTLYPVPELKDAVRTSRPDRVVHDVFIPVETIENPQYHGSTDGEGSSGSSSSSSSSDGLMDSESVSDPTSQSDACQRPPSLSKALYDECTDELGEKESCAYVPGIDVIPPSPLQTPYPHSLDPSSSSRDGAVSIHTSDAALIPDGEGIQVEITQVGQEIQPQRDGTPQPDVRPRTTSPWDEQVEATLEWTELEVFTRTQATCSAPNPTPSEESSIIARSSDGRMTLSLRNFLGAGTYGKVVSATWAEKHKQVAVKVSHKLFISELDCTESGLRSLKNELDVLKALKQSKGAGELGSNFFPELIKSWQDARNVYFVMDLYPCNLEDLRWANADWDASAGDKILWAAELVLGVQALHRMRILHRDIKPANIFVTATRHLVIGDYGLARAWLDPFYAAFPHTSLKARDAPGTMSYLAPEVVRGFYQDAANVEVRKFANYGFEADIWSLGVTICESWCQSAGLFRIQEGEDQDPRTTIPPKILDMKIEPVVKQIVGDHPIWHLITRMLDRNQRSRIGFEEILAHPVFAHLDWNRVASLEYIPTWDFPEMEPPKRPRLVRDEVEFTSYYRPPEEIVVNETDSERVKAEKLERRNGQVLRRAMGAARDWASEQSNWLAGETLCQYDFDWTAPEVVAEDVMWDDDDNDEEEDED